MPESFDKMRGGSGGGVREVLKISLPLVMASMGYAINLFADRVMLANYSQAAVAAAFPAGLTVFALACFFFGTVGYTNAFVAQYFGAKEYRRIGEAVWQGIFFALIGGAFMLGASFWAEPLFHLFRHDPQIEQLEIIYYRILSIGTFLPLLNNALGAFWAGRGRTLMVMLINVTVTLVNIPCNYLLIFGHTVSLPVIGEIVIPRMGVAGAAWGTNLAGAVGVIIYAAAFLGSRRNRQKYATARCAFIPELFRRMLRFGAPNGVQLFLDLATFNVFVVVLGTISPAVQEAAAIAFAFNSLSFMPIIGVGQTVAILVGKAIGASDIPYAERAVRSARLLMLFYMAMMTVFFVIKPEWVMWIFVRAGDAAQVETLELTRHFLRYIAAYVVFDGIFIIYSSAIKGAGDTKFTMWANAALSCLTFMLPCLLYRHYFGDVWGQWTILVGYVMISGLFFYWRYRGGKWQSMRVIESAP